MGGRLSTVGRAVGAIFVCLLLSYDLRELGAESGYGIAAFRALGIAGLALLLGRPALKKLRTWLGTPGTAFPELSTEGVGAATAKALPIYVVVTAVVLAPMLPYFLTRFYADGSDGMQMVWNVWWFKTALFSGRNPFHTEYLHFPSGTTLWGASYHPLKCLLAAPLVPLIGLIPAYNVLFVVTLVGCSLSAFALSFVVSRSFIGSLAAGLAFGFWNNRFAHLNGHLHTVSTELVPLFLLCLLLWLSKPTRSRSIGLSALLLGSFLSDHYAFLFDVFASVIVFGWAVARRRGVRFLFQPPYRGPLALLAATTIATSGALAVYVLSLSRADPWSGAHGPRENSMDLLAPFIPGAYSWMAPWTKGYWSQILSGEIEGSIYPGLTVLMLGLLCYRRARSPWIGLFTLLAAIFWVLALGPSLQVWGHETPLTLPYLFLHERLSFLRMSGVPVRFAQVAVLASAVLAAITLSTLRKKNVVALVICLLAIDLIPRLPAMTAPEAPGFVTFLRELPGQPAVVDGASSMTMALYYQTVHEKPMAFGYVARVPRSREEAEKQLREALNKQDWASLQGAGFAYVVLPKKTTAKLPVVYQDDTTTVYSLGD